MADSKTLGLIKPTQRPDSRSADHLIEMLPAGITVTQTALRIKSGTREELDQALLEYEDKIAEMAQRGVDLVHPAGVPLLLLGYEGEAALVQKWEDKFRTPVFTNGMSQVNALRAYSARRIVGISYFPGPVNKDFGRYLSQAGFEVLEMDGMQVEFANVPATPPEDIRSYIRAMFRRHERVDAIYLLGSAWRTLEMLEDMEREFGVPIIHHIPCQCWEIQRRLGFRVPLTGYGRLMAEMP